MNNSKFKSAISEALTEEYEELIPCYSEEHIFSDDFQKKMDKLIVKQKNPFYKIVNTRVKKAACIIAVIFIAAFTTVMSVDALRNVFKDFFMSIFSDHSEISAVQDESYAVPETIENSFNITYDLSNYDIVYEDSNDFSRNIVYQNDEIIIDYYQYVKSEFDMGVNTENAEINTVTIQNSEAIYFLDNNNYHHLIWDNDEYVIMISSNIGKNELIDIANSVQKVE